MMKNLRTTLRTLCLAVLLFMTSVNAMAYTFYTYGEIQNMVNIWEDNNILVVDGGPYCVNHIETNDYGGNNKPLAIIITKGTTVTVSKNFWNAESGTIYVFGTLNVNVGECDFPRNEGNIYVMEGGSLVGNIVDRANIKYGCSVSDILASHKVKGKTPEFKSEEIIDGWKDFYVKDAIICDYDYYPIPGTTLYYTDETMEKPIDNIELWKQSIGKIEFSIDIYKTKAIDEINEARKDLFYIESYNYQVEGYITNIQKMYLTEYNPSVVENAIAEIAGHKNAALIVIEEWKSAIEELKKLIEARNDAISKINDAMSDVIAYYPSIEKEVEGYISTIQNAESFDVIDNTKNDAFAKIEKIREITNSAYKYYLGTLITKQSGPAVKVTKGDNTIILYGPDKVEFLNNTDEE